MTSRPIAMPVRLDPETVERLTPGAIQARVAFAVGMAEAVRLDEPAPWAGPAAVMRDPVAAFLAETTSRSDYEHRAYALAVASTDLLIGLALEVPEAAEYMADAALASAMRTEAGDDGE